MDTNHFAKLAVDAVLRIKASGSLESINIIKKVLMRGWVGLVNAQNIARQWSMGESNWFMKLGLQRPGRGRQKIESKN